jgi:hypothetical protein
MVAKAEPRTLYLVVCRAGLAKQIEDPRYLPTSQRGSRLRGGPTQSRNQAQIARHCEELRRDCGPRRGPPVCREGPAIREANYSRPIVRAATNGHKRSVPRTSPFILPCEPTLRARPPRGEAWLHEVKFDGFRAQLHKASAEAKIYCKKRARLHVALSGDHLLAQSPPCAFGHPRCRDHGMRKRRGARVLSPADGPLRPRRVVRLGLRSVGARR